MIDTLSQPWPWFVAGPLIGLTVGMLLIVGDRAFGVSSSLQHVCAAVWPGNSKTLQYDWRSKGLWNLVFVVGIGLGGLVAATLLTHDKPVAISEATRADLAQIGIFQGRSLVPTEVYSFGALLGPAGLVVMVVGGLLVGFGARYANGCTSGHAITGLASFQLPSLIATAGFFAGGLLATHLLLPALLSALL